MQIFVGEEKWGRSGRLPSTLQPGPDERPKPRSWLSQPGAWEEARREVEQRREKERLEEMRIVEEGERRRSREQSEAVRKAATKKLDTDVTEDWTYQVRD